MVALKNIVKEKEDRYWNKREKNSVFGGIPGAGRSFRNTGIRDENDPGLTDVMYDPHTTDPREHAQELYERSKQCESAFGSRKRTPGHEIHRNQIYRKYFRKLEPMLPYLDGTRSHQIPSPDRPHSVLSPSIVRLLSSHSRGNPEGWSSRSLP